MWDDSLFPLVVLFSPNLRLRYRAAWERQAKAVCSFLKKEVFSKPVEATHNLAYCVECQNAILDPGTVYVEDDYQGTSGHVSCVVADDRIVAATIFLPREEETPCDTNKVTLQQICFCLGVEIL